MLKKQITTSSSVSLVQYGSSFYYSKLETKETKETKYLKETKDLKCIIFDLDGTLMGETLFPQSVQLLESFKQQGIKQSMASMNPHAKFFCDRYGISKYFDCILSGYVKDNKVGYIKEIVKWYNNNGCPVEEKDCLFIDDDNNNIKCISTSTSVKCIKVNPKEGATFELFTHVNKLT
jgi:phosphoglycolate phosphatase-like HAD superfamily hydrolase